MNKHDANPEATHVVRELTHDRELHSCRYDPTGQAVAAGSADNSVVRWNLQSGKKTVLARHDSWVRGLAFLPDESILVSAGYDGRLVWWPNADDATEPIRVVDAHKAWIRALEVSPDGALIATAGNDHVVKLFRSDGQEQVATLTGHEAEIRSLLFHPQGQFLLSGDLHGDIRQWNLDNMELVRQVDAKALRNFHSGQRVYYGGVRAMAVNQDSRRLFAGGLHKATNPLGAIQEPLIAEFDWESGEQKSLLESEGNLRAGVWRLIHHPAGFLICVSGSQGGYLMFYKPSEAKPFHQFKVAGSAFDGDLHPDGIHIATAHHDNRVRISRMAKKEAG